MASSRSDSRISPVFLQCGQEGWRRFSDPVRTLRAESAAEVRPALDEIESATQKGLYAAGFLSYEAASAFDAALVTRPAGALPLLWFGIYETCEFVELPRPLRPPDGSRPADAAPQWEPSLTLDEHRSSVDRIRERIALGDTYQVNFTWRLKAPFDGNPWTFFLALADKSPSRYAAFVEFGAASGASGHAICSLSPELFFRLDGSKLVCRPMKGTSRRGLYRAQDDERSRELRESAKNRAENVMIVDMVRNDLGKIARPGSVETTRLFEVETYPTVLQMTSTVEAATDSSLVEIMTALFPCASITGAPKVETMKIIAELEDRPRGIYTGAIGYVGPNRQALFNVAIRTVHLDRDAGCAEYGTGGGIVWDSEPEAEYLEGRTKALVLAPGPPNFSLLETLRWENGEYHLLRRHLDRLADSADFLGFDYDESHVRSKLRRLSERLAERLAEHPARRLRGPIPLIQRIRLLLSRAGSVRLEHERIDEENRPWTIELAQEPIDPDSQFLYHKTTEREVYDSFRRRAPNADDVLLWNPAGELTEATVANIALQLEGRWVTPPVACGLLAGTQRAELLAHGRLTERVLTLGDLDRADSLALLNSVRGWIPARLTTKTGERARPTQTRRQPR